MFSKEKSQKLPSTRWAYFGGWDYNGMEERLEIALGNIDKSALLSHAKHFMGKDVAMSASFSAGQYWMCFEIVAADGRLVIARVRLPRHPDLPSTVSDEDMEYSTQCELATMQYIQKNLSSVRIPRVYAYEPVGSPRATAAGASYMLIEGFYGNTLIDVKFDMTLLPTNTQKRIIDQWTKVQAELATLTLSGIGSISSLSNTGEPVLGKLASASVEGFQNSGPFACAAEYFLAAGHAALARLATEGDSTRWARLGAAIFCDIVSKTAMFQDMGVKGYFHLNHMDLGTQNMLVDDDFHLVAIIDWEFAQSAPWQVNHYPMPFPLLGSREKTENILADPDHVAHKKELRQELARQMYRDGFRAAEEELKNQGRPLAHSLTDSLDSTASRIYVCFANLGRMPQQDEELMQNMVGMPFGWDDAKTKSYMAEMEAAL